MAQLFAVGAESFLRAPLAIGGTSLLVDAALADLFPVANTDLNPVATTGKDWYKLVIENALGQKEVVYARTRVLGNANILNLQRGQEGTTARDYTADNTVVRISYTAQDLQAAIDLGAITTAAGKALMSGVDASAQMTTLGFSAYFKTLIVAANAGAIQTLLGMSAFFKTLLSAVDAAAMRSLTGTAPRATRIDVASVAGTVDLTANAPDCDDIRMTGALAVTDFVVAAGRVIRVTAAAAHTLVSGANLVTQRGANIVCGAGDSYSLRATAANVVEVFGYVRAMDSLGVGQPWQNMTASRAFGVTYTNSTGRPIGVAVAVSIGAAGNNARITTGGGIVLNGTSAYVASATSEISAVIPAGDTYTVIGTGGGSSIVAWNEMR